MDPAALIDRLARFPAALRGVTGVFPEEALRWKPDGATWSVLEVCCHLLDEEREDFRPRLRSTLEDPAAPWPPLDLESVAQRRGYSARDLAQTLAQFAAERLASVTWLRSLAAPDWDATHRHPKAGPLRAGDLLAAWAAHDALHLRQIAKRLLDLARRDAGGFKTDYAGD